MDIYTITILVTNFAGLFVLERLMKVFFNKRRTSLPVMFFIYSLYFVAVGTQHFLLRNMNDSIRFSIQLLIYLLGYFAITLIYESTTRKRIGVTIVSYTVTTIMGILTATIVEIIWPTLVTGSAEYSIVVNTAYIPISYLTVLLLLRFKSIRKSSAFFPSVIIGPMLLILLLIVFMIFDSELMSSLSMITVILVLLVSSLSGLFYYNKLSKLYEEKLNLALQAQEREYYLAQCQLMQNSVEQVRAIRHDMKSHLATVRGLSKDKKAEEVTTYVDSLLGDIRTSEVYSDTGNIVFDSILNFKLQNAQEDNVRIDLHLFIPNSLTMEITDIATILGNLIDNSLTAISKVSEKWIKIDMEYSRKCLFIQVQNSFDGNVIYSNEETKEIQSSKTAENSASEEHGFGLKNIKKAVEKYNGQMDITHADKVFSVTILLYGV